MADYDSPWKEALDFFFADFLQLFFPEAHADIDWDRPCESLDKELQQIAPEAEIGRRYVDKLFKVWLKSGREQWVLVHVEVQMTDEAEFPWRMYGKFGLVKGLRRRGWSETQVRRLFKLIDWLMELPPPLAGEFWKELKQYEEKQQMPFITTPERYGRIAGCLEGRLEDIETILEVRFPDAGAQLMPEIRLISDAEQLRKILRTAATVASPEELRKLWAGGPAG